MENKTKKIITKPIMKSYKEDPNSIIEIIMNMKKFKKKNYAKNRNKDMSDKDREREKKEYLRNY